MATIRVVISGAKGQMGQLAQTVLAAHADLACVGCIHRGDDFKATLASYQPDVLLDLTAPDCVMRHTETAIAMGIRPVIGTSGLTHAQVLALQDQAKAKGLGGVIAPNFSIAAVLMMQCAALCARHMPNASIIEAHHPNKKDAPSGTAVKTATVIAEHRQQTPMAHHSTEHMPGALGHVYQGVPIHALRQPGVIADQTVCFAGHGEQLTLKHHTQDRACFGPGMILACQAAMDLNHVVYGLEHILFAAQDAVL